MMKLDENGVFQRGRIMRNVLLSASRGFALLSAVAFAILADGAYAGDVITWTDASGDHLWNTAANWDLNRVPDINGSDAIHIPSGDWRIIRSGGTQKYGQFYIDDGTGTVTLDGAGSATTVQPLETADLKIGEGRQLAVTNRAMLQLRYDIPFTNGVLKVQSGGEALFNTPNAAVCTIGGTARVFVEGGSFCNNSTQLYITNKAEVVVSGGLIRVQRYRVCGPDSPGEQGPLFRILGGTVWNSTSYAYTSRIYPGGRFENRGGTVLWGTGTDFLYEKLSSAADDFASGSYGFASFLPQKGGLLNLTSKDDCTWSGQSDNAGALYFALDGDYSFGGDIFATNTAAAAADTSPGFVCFDTYRTVGLTGGGRIYANGFMQRQADTVNIDISAVYLGGGGIQQGSNCKMFFQNDLVIGAWGDWSALRGQYSRITFAGDIVFDTLDCFDKTTPHTISLQAGFLDVTSLKAVGGGSVALSPSNYETPWPALLHSLVVDDNTSLLITNSTETIKTGSLSLGAGSTLTFDLLSEKRYIDVLGHLAVGSGARIIVKAPASLTAGKIYPVLFAPADFEIPDGLVQFEGSIPSGWTLVKRSNLLYLSDGEVSYTTPSSEFNWYWTGAADGDVGNVDNWTTNASPFSATGNQYKFAFFEGTKNMDVDISNLGHVYGISIDDDAGPFVFSGGQITVYTPLTGHREGGSSTRGGITSNSDFPCVFKNDLKHNRDVYLAESFKSGSISLMGNKATSSGMSDFYFCGDVRLGGVWDVSYFNVITNSAAPAAKRPHTLSLLSGASLSASDQDAQDFDRKQQFLLAPASTLTISGTTCRFLEANTHSIDGTLTVNGTLDAQAKQTFLGGGTNKFQSATGELDFKGNMTIVPGSLVGNVTVSLKGEPTIAPEADWTYGGDASIDLDDHSTLTLATGGHKLTLAKPIASQGALAVTGNGTVEIAAEGMTLDKVTMADGATFAVAEDLISSGAYVDVLAVHEDDDSVAFSPAIRKLRKRVGENGYTVYSVKGKKGMMLIFR